MAEDLRRSHRGVAHGPALDVEESLPRMEIRVLEVRAQDGIAGRQRVSPSRLGIILPRSAREQAALPIRALSLLAPRTPCRPAAGNTDRTRRTSVDSFLG